MTYLRLTRDQADRVFDVLVAEVGCEERLRRRFVGYWSGPRGGRHFKFPSSFHGRPGPTLRFSATDGRVTASARAFLGDYEYSGVTEATWLISHILKEPQPWPLLGVAAQQRERLSGLAERQGALC